MDDINGKMSETVDCTNISNGVPFSSDSVSNIDSLRLEGYKVQDKTMFSNRSSIESNLSFPSREPSLLDELRTSLENKTFMKSRPHRNVSVDFSLSSSSGSHNTTLNTNEASVLVSKGRKLNLFSRQRKKELNINFTLGDESSSTVENEQPSETSMNLSRAAIKPGLNKRPAKRVSVRFDCLDSSVSDDSKTISVLEDSMPETYKVPKLRSTHSGSRRKINEHVNVDFTLNDTDVSEALTNDSANFSLSLPEKSFNSLDSKDLKTKQSVMPSVYSGDAPKSNSLKRVPSPDSSFVGTSEKNSVCEGKQLVTNDCDKPGSSENTEVSLASDISKKLLDEPTVLRCQKNTTEDNVHQKNNISSCNPTNYESHNDSVSDLSNTSNNCGTTHFSDDKPLAIPLEGPDEPKEISVNPTEAALPIENEQRIETSMNLSRNVASKRGFKRHASKRVSVRFDCLDSSVSDDSKSSIVLDSSSMPKTRKVPTLRSTRSGGLRKIDDVDFTLNETQASELLTNDSANVSLSLRNKSFNQLKSKDLDTKQSDMPSVSSGDAPKSNFLNREHSPDSIVQEASEQISVCEGKQLGTNDCNKPGSSENAEVLLSSGIPRSLLDKPTVFMSWQENITKDDIGQQNEHISHCPTNYDSLNVSVSDLSNKSIMNSKTNFSDDISLAISPEGSDELAEKAVNYPAESPWPIENEQLSDTSMNLSRNGASKPGFKRAVSKRVSVRFDCLDSSVTDDSKSSIVLDSSSMPKTRKVPTHRSTRSGGLRKIDEHVNVDFTVNDTQTYEVLPNDSASVSSLPKKSLNQVESKDLDTKQSDMPSVSSGDAPESNSLNREHSPDSIVQEASEQISVCEGKQLVANDRNKLGSSKNPEVSLSSDIPRSLLDKPTVVVISQDNITKDDIDQQNDLIYRGPTNCESQNDSVSDLSNKSIENSKTIFSDDISLAISLEGSDELAEKAVNYPAESPWPIENEQLSDTSMNLSRNDASKPGFKRPVSKRVSVRFDCLDSSVSDDSKSSIVLDTSAMPKTRKVPTLRSTRSGGLRKIDEHVNLDFTLNDTQTSEVLTNDSANVSLSLPKKSFNQVKNKDSDTKQSDMPSVSSGDAPKSNSLNRERSPDSIVQEASKQISVCEGKQLVSNDCNKLGSSENAEVSLSSDIPRSVLDKPTVVVISQENITKDDIDQQNDLISRCPTNCESHNDSVSDLSNKSIENSKTNFSGDISLAISLEGGDELKEMAFNYPAESPWPIENEQLSDTSMNLSRNGASKPGFKRPASKRVSVRFDCLDSSVSDDSKSGVVLDSSSMPKTCKVPTLRSTHSGRLRNIDEYVNVDFTVNDTQASEVLTNDSANVSLSLTKKSFNEMKSKDSDIKQSDMPSVSSGDAPKSYTVNRERSLYSIIQEASEQISVCEGKQLVSNDCNKLGSSENAEVSPSSDIQRSLLDKPTVVVISQENITKDDIDHQNEVISRWPTNCEPQNVSVSDQSSKTNLSDDISLAISLEESDELKEMAVNYPAESPWPIENDQLSDTSMKLSRNDASKPGFKRPASKRVSVRFDCLGSSVSDDSKSGVVLDSSSMPKTRKVPTLRSTRSGGLRKIDEHVNVDFTLNDTQASEVLTNDSKKSFNQVKNNDSDTKQSDMPSVSSGDAPKGNSLNREHSPDSIVQEASEHISVCEGKQLVVNDCNKLGSSENAEVSISSDIPRSLLDKPTVVVISQENITKDDINQQNEVIFRCPTNCESQNVSVSDQSSKTNFSDDISLAISLGESDELKEMAVNYPAESPWPIENDQLSDTSMKLSRNDASKPGFKRPASKRVSVRFDCLDSSVSDDSKSGVMLDSSSMPKTRKVPTLRSTRSGGLRKIDEHVNVDFTLNDTQVSEVLTNDLANVSVSLPNKSFNQVKNKDSGTKQSDMPSVSSGDAPKSNSLNRERSPDSIVQEASEQISVFEGEQLVTNGINKLGSSENAEVSLSSDIPRSQLVKPTFFVSCQGNIIKDDVGQQNELISRFPSNCESQNVSVPDLSNKSIKNSKTHLADDIPLVISLEGSDQPSKMSINCPDGPTTGEIMLEVPSCDMRDVSMSLTKPDLVNGSHKENRVENITFTTSSTRTASDYVDPGEKSVLNSSMHLLEKKCLRSNQALDKNCTDEQLNLVVTLGDLNNTPENSVGHVRGAKLNDFIENRGEEYQKDADLMPTQISPGQNISTNMLSKETVHIPNFSSLKAKALETSNQPADIGKGASANMSPSVHEIMTADTIVPPPSFKSLVNGSTVVVSTRQDEPVPFVNDSARQTIRSSHEESIVRITEEPTTGEIMLEVPSCDIRDVSTSLTKPDLINGSCKENRVENIAFTTSSIRASSDHMDPREKSVMNSSMHPLEKKCLRSNQSHVKNCTDEQLNLVVTLGDLDNRPESSVDYVSGAKQSSFIGNRREEYHKDADLMPTQISPEQVSSLENISVNILSKERVQDIQNVSSLKVKALETLDQPADIGKGTSANMLTSVTTREIIKMDTIIPPPSFKSLVVEGSHEDQPGPFVNDNAGVKTSADVRSVPPAMNDEVPSKMQPSDNGSLETLKSKEEDVINYLPLPRSILVDTVNRQTPTGKHPKSKRKSISFKPSVENVYHSPPEYHCNESNQNLSASTSKQIGEGYEEFSRIQMTSEISDIQQSTRVTRSKRHCSSTPLPKSKKRCVSFKHTMRREAEQNDEIFAKPVPVTSSDHANNEFLVPPLPLFATKPSSRLSSGGPRPYSPLKPVGPVESSPEEKKENQAAGGESSSSEKTSVDLSYENSLDISAIPKDKTGPNRGNVFHSTPIHRSKTSKTKFKKKFSPAVPHPVESGVVSNLVNDRSVNTSRNLRSQSKQESLLSKSEGPSQSRDRSHSETRSRSRSSRSRSDLQTESRRGSPEISTQSIAKESSEDSSSPSRISIKDNTVLSSQATSHSRARGFTSSRSARSSYPTGESSFISYDSHRKLTSRRLFTHNALGDEEKPDGSLNQKASESSSGTSISKSPNSLAVEGPSTKNTDLLDDNDSDVDSISSPQRPGSSRDDSVASSGADSVAPYIVPHESLRSQIDSLRRSSRASSVSSDGSEVSLPRKSRHLRPKNIQSSTSSGEFKVPRSKFSLSRKKSNSENNIFAKIPKRSKGRPAIKSRGDESVVEWSRKPRKLFKPGKWASKKLYSWLELKLRDKHGLRTTLNAEKMVIELQHAYLLVANGHLDGTLDTVRERAVEMGLCTTELEFWSFIHKFMPFDFRVKTIPMGGAFGSAIGPKILPYDAL